MVSFLPLPLTFIFPFSLSVPYFHHDRFANRIKYIHISIGSTGCGVRASASRAVAVATASTLSNRSATTITAKTAFRTPAWCSQCVVR